jgi:Ni/Co efflux regulator RcnB
MSLKLCLRACTTTLLGLALSATIAVAQGNGHGHDKHDRDDDDDRRYDRDDRDHGHGNGHNKGHGHERYVDRDGDIRGWYRTHYNLPACAAECSPVRASSRSCFPRRPRTTST